uniref:Uncharacterized protein n=1 Tax=Physcomitrium patens TaxID=3218 RepID=A0A7I4EJ33_PHYPA
MVVHSSECYTGVNFGLYCGLYCGLPGNIGNIPLVIMGAICREKGNPLEDPETCNTNGVAYISFGQWVGAVIVYRYVYSMLAPPSKPKGVDGSTSSDVVGANGSDETNIEPTISHATSVSMPLLIHNNSPPPRRQGWDLVNAWLSYGRIQDILQPPVVASFLALLFGCVPLLRSLIFTEHSFLYFLFDSLNILGGAAVPCIMLVLGGNLVGGAGASKLGVRTTVVIVATRLLIIPPKGICSPHS